MIIMFTFEIQADTITPAGTIYIIPRFIRCKHYNHEIPIGTVKITGMIDCHGGCGKRSSVIDYTKYFGRIDNIKF